MGSVRRGRPVGSEATAGFGAARSRLSGTTRAACPSVAARSGRIPGTGAARSDRLPAAGPAPGTSAAWLPPAAVAEPSASPAAPAWVRAPASSAESGSAAEYRVRRPAGICPARRTGWSAESPASRATGSACPARTATGLRAAGLRAARFRPAGPTRSAGPALPTRPARSAVSRIWITRIRRSGATGSSTGVPGLSGSARRDADCAAAISGGSRPEHRAGLVAA